MTINRRAQALTALACILLRMLVYASSFLLPVFICLTCTLFSTFPIFYRTFELLCLAQVFLLIVDLDGAFCSCSTVHSNLCFFFRFCVHCRISPQILVLDWQRYPQLHGSLIRATCIPTILTG